VPENSAIAVPSPAGLKNESCFSAVAPVSGWNQWRVMGRALLERPVLHRLGDGAGEVGVERRAAGDRGLQAGEDVARQAPALDGGREDLRAEGRQARGRRGGCGSGGRWRGERAGGGVRAQAGGGGGSGGHGFSWRGLRRADG